MKPIHPTLATALLALLAGCSSGPTGTTPQLDELPRPLTVSELEVIDGSNDFAFGLFRAVNDRVADGNVFISPLSVSMALGMTMNGTAGTTFDEISSTLGFGGLSQAEINTAYRDLLDLLVDLDPSVAITIANSVWYRQGFPFEQTFFDTVSESFDAEVEALDFDAPSAVPTINDWVERATSGRIDRIVEALRPEHVMLLINAIHFKGDWRHRFDPAQTRDDTFTGTDGAQLPVRMMNNDGTFRVGRSAAFETLELPYGNGAFSMMILLPNQGVAVDDVLAELDSAAWQQAVQGLAEQRLMVSVPRFQLEFEESLVEPLQALGIEAAFHPGVADFTGMASGAPGDLYISDVKHKTFVDVNEEGTEAAAVTSVEISVTSMPPSFRVDRPFVFAIRERFSGTILFVGKIVAP